MTNEPFFPRGNGPLVSVLLPTRGSPELLTRCIDSLISKATDPRCLEILLKLDYDDQPNIACAQRLASNYSIRIGAVVTVRGSGYYDIHHYLNNLAVAAKGDWLFIFNDDATIVTQGWDDLLRDCGTPMCWHGCPADVMMLSCEMLGKPNANDFFLLRRKTAQLLGHVCRSPGGDVWLSRLLGILASHARIPIEVDHQRDPERQLRHQEPPAWVGPLMMSTQMLSLQMADALRLLGHIQSHEAQAVWATTSPVEGWCRFRSETGGSAYYARVEGENATVFDWGGGVDIYRLADMGGEWLVQERGVYHA